MLKKNEFEESPLIIINWKKIWHYVKLFINKIIFVLGTVILGNILKFILKVFIFLIQKFLLVYKGIKKFAKKNIKGRWILFLLLIFLIISALYIWKKNVYAQKIIKEQKQTQEMLNEQQNINTDLMKKNEELEKDIILKDKKLKAKAEEQAKFAHQQWILENRQMAEKKLPEEVKCLISKYADTYGVKDIRFMQCIVFKESGGRDEAVGDSGKAIGVAQYHLATFLGHRKQMGLTQVDLRKDTEASIQAMMFSVGRGGVGNWSARVKCI